jgi:Sporulation and spore germination/Immunoglobulin-like domain of bacterial spore germination
MRSLRFGLLVALFLAVSSCGSGIESTTTVTEASVPPSSRSVATTSAPPSSAATPTTVPATITSPATAAPTTTTPPSMIDVKVYFLRDERLVTAHRLVPGPAVLRGAMAELLAGPTDAELADGLGSAVPDGTELLGVDLGDGLATVDLSSEFESGGGSLSMTARVAQVVFTATQFDNADRTLLRMDGRPIEFLGGEGLVLDQPLARMDVDRDLSGSVIIDSPAYGATVSSPFRVTGEGDVYEAQFPIEIWANGEQIGGIAPVTAGAWGTWADFEVTITLDAPAGPIELVAYDPGGCGTGPDCPPIIETVVPLTLAD